MRCSPVSAAAGGWCFPADPANFALTAAPLWKPQIFPATVIVTNALDGFAASSLPDQFEVLLSSTRSAEGLHAVVAEDEGDHRIWVADEDQPVTTAFVIPRDRHFLWRMRNALRLHLHLEKKPTGRRHRDQLLSRFQIHRASLMLRSWDAVESGASRRHVASILLNPDVADMRALDWKNAPERRRLARILKAARETIEGGYLDWLVPSSRQPNARLPSRR